MQRTPYEDISAHVRERRISMSQRERYERFLALHQRPTGFVMPNAWDATSALLLKEAGFEAIGTSSAAIAAALGRLDGRHAVSRAEHIANAQLLGRMSGLPINGDFEDGYGDTADDVAATVEAAIAAGLAGLGIEDTSGDPQQPIRPFDDAVSRVRAAAKVAKGRIVLTGRTDNYLQGNPDLDDTIRRLTAFAEVGADVLYAPYPTDMDAVVAIVRAVAPKPVNLVVGTMSGALPVAELQKAGVKRISLGVALYMRVMKDLRAAAQELAAGDLASASNGIPFREIMAMIGKAPAV
jgi:2-methylisocitrate lyase-like PEP mutase family enzyme